MRLFFVTVTLALLATPSLAQTPLGRPETPWERRALGITPAQTAQRTAILKRYIPKLQTISKKYEKDAEAYRKSKKTPADTQAYQSAMKKLQAESAPVLAQAQKEIEALYTPEQRAKLKALRDKLQKTLQKPKDE